MPAAPRGFGWVLRESRLWLAVLWALAVALGAAGWQWGSGQLAQQAAANLIFLCPRTPLDETAQRDWQSKLAREPAILTVRWLAPAEVSKQLSQAIDTPGLAEQLSSADASGSFPALLELTPDAPLQNTTTLNDFIAARTAEGTWWVFFDSARQGQLRGWRSALLPLCGGWILLTLALGALGLTHLSWPTQGGWKVATLAGLLGAFAPLALLQFANLAGTSFIDAGTLALAAMTGLLLAGGLASVLRQRGGATQPKRPSQLPAPHAIKPGTGAPPDDDVLERGGAALNISVKEAPDERDW